MAVNKKSLETNTNLIVSISAIVISLGSLFFNYIQTDLIAKQQKASVLPYLQITNSMKSAKNKISFFKYSVVNNGLGPAFIKKVSVIYEGKEIKNTDVVSFLSNKNLINTFTSSGVSEGTLLPAGQTIEHLTISDTIASEKVSDLLNSEKLRLKIVYASVYDGLWEVTGFNNPKKIKD